MPNAHGVLMYYIMVCFILLLLQTAMEGNCSPDEFLVASDLVRRIQLSKVITGDLDSCNITDFIEIPPKETTRKLGRPRNHCCAKEEYSMSRNNSWK